VFSSQFSDLFAPPFSPSQLDRVPPVNVDLFCIIAPFFSANSFSLLPILQNKSQVHFCSPPVFLKIVRDQVCSDGLRASCSPTASCPFFSSLQLLSFVFTRPTPLPLAFQTPPLQWPFASVTRISPSFHAAPLVAPNSLFKSFLLLWRRFALPRFFLFPVRSIDLHCKFFSRLFLFILPLSHQSVPFSPPPMSVRKILVPRSPSFSTRVSFSL